MFDKYRNHKVDELIEELDNNNNNNCNASIGNINNDTRINNSIVLESCRNNNNNNIELNINSDRDTKSNTNKQRCKC